MVDLKFESLPFGKRGVQRRKRLGLEQALEQAGDYVTWRAAAEELDRLEGNASFKQEDASRHYDAALIRERLHEIRRLRSANDGPGLIFFLRQGLLRNLGNLANPALYNHTRTGTKALIDDYVSAVVASLNFVTEPSFTWSDDDELLKFLRETLQSFGRSALLLSGGANFGIFHIGVARALWRAGLLPRVFSGASTGAIIVGMLGTHADQELPRIFELEPSLRLDVWATLGFSDARQSGALFDQKQLEVCVRSNLGDLTFLEAFEKTGRAINISVSAAMTDHKPRLLNYLTTPHLMVWSAVMASCALPVLFPPVVMLGKRPDGSHEPYMHGLRWLDGSMRSDLPMRRLGELYNVNHHVVSQANPHIAPFVGDRAATPLTLLRDLAMGEVQHRSQQVLSVLQMASPFRFAEQGLMALDAIMGQTYQGDITVSPPTKLAHYLNLTGNLSREQASTLVRAGELATWARMTMIRNQTKIGQTLERCVRRLEARVQSAPDPGQLPDADGHSWP